MSEFPLSNKVNPKKFALLETRIEGEGGIPSSFTPPRGEITCTSSLGDFSRLTNVNSNMTFGETSGTNPDGEASQSTCKTLKCGNVSASNAVVSSHLVHMFLSLIESSKLNLPAYHHAPNVRRAIPHSKRTQKTSI